MINGGVGEAQMQFSICTSDSIRISEACVHVRVRTKVIHGQISIGIKNIFSQIIASMDSISSKTVVSVKKVPLG